MIINSHPTLTAMEQSPFRFHLIGSRFVGIFTEKSDYDFIVEVENYPEWAALKAWMVAQGFKPSSPGGYGPDGRLFHNDIWTHDGDARSPAVDILPMTKKEASMRLRWFNAMRSAGNESGLIAKALKKEKAWPLLWDVLSACENDKTEVLSK